MASPKCCACHDFARPEPRARQHPIPLDSCQMLPLPRKHTLRCTECCACHDFGNGISKVMRLPRFGARRRRLISCQALLRASLTLRPGAVKRPALQAGGFGRALGRRRRCRVFHRSAGSCPLLWAPGVLPAARLVRQDPLSIGLLLRRRGRRLRSPPLVQDGRPAALKLSKRGRGAPSSFGLKQRLDPDPDIFGDPLHQSPCPCRFRHSLQSGRYVLQAPGASTLAPTAAWSQNRQLPACS